MSSMIFSLDRTAFDFLLKFSKTFKAREVYRPYNELNEYEFLLSKGYNDWAKTLAQFNDFSFQNGSIDEQRSNKILWVDEKGVGRTALGVAIAIGNLDLVKAVLWSYGYSEDKFERNNVNIVAAQKKCPTGTSNGIIYGCTGAKFSAYHLAKKWKRTEILKYFDDKGLRSCSLGSIWCD